MAHLLGIDLGSSSVKVSLVDASSGKQLYAVQSPTNNELRIHAKQAGWAEQDPSTWWTHVEKAIAKLAQKQRLADVLAIGIAYQMHGLVMLDKTGKPVRKSIIWCDSRAVELGDLAFNKLGVEDITNSTLNSPGNFTASKWAWVAQNEPRKLAKVTSVLLPGDYIAFKLTGHLQTTPSGLSEMVLWDFNKQQLADNVMNAHGLDPDILPQLVPSFGDQGDVLPSLIKKFGLNEKVKVTYRAGDQPNNAYSLKALSPGETAATAGTSGVVYAVTDQQQFDTSQRVNSFRHVTSTSEAQRLGILLCINGTGSAYAWLRRTLGAGGVLPGYPQLNEWANTSEIGSKGLLFYPFGNGAERMLCNQAPGSTFRNLSFNMHGPEELSAAVQDGIAASLAMGSSVLSELGASPKVIRAGRANLFLSDRFCQAFSQLTGVPLELYDTDGAQGAARAAGVGAGVYDSHEEALSSLEQIGIFHPQESLQEAYENMYRHWEQGLTTTN